MYHFKDKIVNLSTMKIEKKVSSWGLKLIAAAQDHHSIHYDARTIVSQLLCPMLILKQITFYDIIINVSLLTNKTRKILEKHTRWNKAGFTFRWRPEITANVYICYRLCGCRMFLINRNLKVLSSILSEKNEKQNTRNVNYFGTEIKKFWENVIEKIKIEKETKQKQ